MAKETLGLAFSSKSFTPLTQLYHFSLSLHILSPTPRPHPCTLHLVLGVLRLQPPSPHSLGKWDSGVPQLERR